MAINKYSGIKKDGCAAVLLKMEEIKCPPLGSIEKMLL
jgi:hypothetical protein